MQTFSNRLWPFVIYICSFRFIDSYWQQLTVVAERSAWIKQKVPFLVGFSRLDWTPQCCESIADNTHGSAVLADLNLCNHQWEQWLLRALVLKGWLCQHLFPPEGWLICSFALNYREKTFSSVEALQGQDVLLLKDPLVTKVVLYWSSASDRAVYDYSQFSVII